MNIVSRKNMRVTEFVESEWFIQFLYHNLSKVGDSHSDHKHESDKIIIFLAHTRMLYERC